LEIICFIICHNFLIAGILCYLVLVDNIFSLLDSPYFYFLASIIVYCNVIYFTILLNINYQIINNFPISCEEIVPELWIILKLQSYYIFKLESYHVIILFQILLFIASVARNKSVILTLIGDE
jgi:hypothetical protein